jgi:hypothetical protein
MSDTSAYRVTIRLPPELYAQLEARGSHGQPMAAIVRQALVEYLARQPHTSEQAVELATRVDILAARGEPTAADPPQARTPGRQRKLTPRQLRARRDKHQRGVPVPALMEEYGISRASVFRYLQSDKR